MTDGRRRLNGATAGHHFLQYPEEDMEPFPQMKSYEDYWQIGYRAEITGRVDKLNGIKGLWKLHQLPYMRDIFWAKDGMHAMANVVKDSINVLRPTERGFLNRTEKTTVRNACKKLRIFKELWIPEETKDAERLDEETKQGYLEEEQQNVQRARWTLTPEQIARIHDQLKYLPTGLRKPFKTGGGEYSHDQLLFATVYAPMVIPVEDGIGCPLVTTNILNVFSIITALTCHEFCLNDHDQLMDYIYDVVSDHEGLLPPSEATYTLHEMVHVAKQIIEVGPPLMVSMFKYERQNKYLKNLL